MGVRSFYEAVRTRWAVQATRDNVQAVDELGLARVLENTQLRRKFERGEMKCKFCRTSVSEGTVYALLRDSGTVKAICGDAQCVSRFVEWIEAHQS